MRALIQRVKNACVTVGNTETGKIGKGLVVLLGVGRDDTREAADWIAKKLSVLRVFEDADGKTNLSALDVGGSLLIVSQFTLYADCQKGSRPGFSDAAPPALAEELYEYFIGACRQYFPHVETGEFGADMALSLVNDGPFTVMLTK